MNSMIFYPPKYRERELTINIDPGDEHKYIESTNGTKISVYVSKPEGDNTKYFVFAHGNSATILGFLPYFRNLQDSFNTGFILFDYQGYGCSEGVPSEKNCYDDITAVMNFAIYNLNIKRSDLYLIGNSLGTGIIVDYAYNNNWQTPIILISPYKTIVKVVFDYSCVRPIDKFRTEGKIGYLNCPVKIFHGEKDDLIHINHAKYLYSLLKNKGLEPSWIEDADHSNIFQHIQFDELMHVLNYK